MLPKILYLELISRYTPVMFYQPPSGQPNIIYKDASLLIVDKPAELLSVPGRQAEHQDCLITRLQQNDPEALIVHRLDMSTSGLMVVARNPEVQRNLSRQFALRQVGKTYLAVVAGKLSRQAGEIDLPLICDWLNRPKQAVDSVQGKAAHTSYRLLNYDIESDTSHIELTPTTGRTHQLRVHMQAIGHPILGDDLYADRQTCSKAERLLLHASSLQFTHPASGEAVCFTLPAPF